MSRALYEIGRGRGRGRGGVAQERWLIIILLLQHPFSSMFGIRVRCSLLLQRTVYPDVSFRKDPKAKLTAPFINSNLL